MIEVLLVVAGGVITGAGLWGWDKMKARHAADVAKAERKLRGQKAAEQRRLNKQRKAVATSGPGPNDQTDPAFYGRKSNGEAKWGGA